MAPLTNSGFPTPTSWWGQSLPGTLSLASLVVDLLHNLQEWKLVSPRKKNLQNEGLGTKSNPGSFWGLRASGRSFIKGKLLRQMQRGWWVTACAHSALRWKINAKVLVASNLLLFSSTLYTQVFKSPAAPAKKSSDPLKEVSKRTCHPGWRIKEASKWKLTAQAELTCLRMEAEDTSKFQVSKLAGQEHNAGKDRNGEGDYSEMQH